MKEIELTSSSKRLLKLSKRAFLNRLELKALLRREPLGNVSYMGIKGLRKRRTYFSARIELAIQEALVIKKLIEEKGWVDLQPTLDLLGKRLRDDINSREKLSELIVKETHRRKNQG